MYTFNDYIQEEKAKIINKHMELLAEELSLYFEDIESAIDYIPPIYQYEYHEAVWRSRMNPCEWGAISPAHVPSRLNFMVNYTEIMAHRKELTTKMHMEHMTEELANFCRALQLKVDKEELDTFKVNIKKEHLCPPLGIARVTKMLEEDEREEDIPANGRLPPVYRYRYNEMWWALKTGHAGSWIPAKNGLMTLPIGRLPSA